MTFANNTNGSHSEAIIIGIDHGYGNIKTANHCFKAGVTAYDTEPTFKRNLLVYDGRY
jgi:plasmid segregation protein ParM